MWQDVHGCGMVLGQGVSILIKKQDPWPISKLYAIKEIIVNQNGTQNHLNFKQKMVKDSGKKVQLDDERWIAVQSKDFN